MKMSSRRTVLLTLVVAPVVSLTPRIPFCAPHAMTVGEAMRYLCEEVFPSPCQKRDESHCFSDCGHKKESI